MKKTHLYGAVAATMLLAPVTANVLAAEEGEVPSETVLETQNSGELSERPVLSVQEDQEVESVSDNLLLLHENTETKNADINSESKENADNINGVNANNVDTENSIQSNEENILEEEQISGGGNTINEVLKKETEESNIQLEEVDEEVSAPELKLEDQVVLTPFVYTDHFSSAFSQYYGESQKITLQQYVDQIKSIHLTFRVNPASVDHFSTYEYDGIVLSKDYAFDSAKLDPSTLCYDCSAEIEDLIKTYKLENYVSSIETLRSQVSIWKEYNHEKQSWTVYPHIEEYFDYGIDPNTGKRVTEPDLSVIGFNLWEENPKAPFIDKIEISAEEIEIPSIPTGQDLVQMNLQYYKIPAMTFEEMLNFINLTVSEYGEEHFSWDYILNWKNIGFDKLIYKDGTFYVTANYDLKDIVTSFEEKVGHEMTWPETYPFIFSYDLRNKIWLYTPGIWNGSDWYHYMGAYFSEELSVRAKGDETKPSYDSAKEDEAIPSEEDCRLEKVIKDFLEENKIKVSLDQPYSSEAIVVTEEMRNPLTGIFSIQKLKGEKDSRLDIAIDARKLANILGYEDDVYFADYQYISKDSQNYRLKEKQTKTLYFASDGKWHSESEYFDIYLDYFTLDIQKLLDQFNNDLNDCNIVIKDESKHILTDLKLKDLDLSKGITLKVTSDAPLEIKADCALKVSDCIELYETMKKEEYKESLDQYPIFSFAAYYDNGKVLLKPTNHFEYGEPAGEASGYSTDLIVFVKRANEELKKVYNGDCYSIYAEATEDLADTQVIMKEVTSNENFGYSDQYQTTGYRIYLADLNGNPVKKNGTYEGSFWFPEQFDMHILHGKMINAVTNEVIWEEDMGWYRLEEIGFDEENLDFIFVAAEKKKEDPKPEEPEPETPIKTEATFTQDGYQVKAESKEDLTGLRIVINEIEADNNFGLTSDYQTIGYDIHFENEKGEEVTRTGNFTVRIPIPTKFIGKEVRLFHKENKDSNATELPFKIIDGKYYEFETTSFSWFIVASQTTNTEPVTPEQPTQPGEEKPEQPKPADPIEQPTTPADEANKPQEKPIDSTVKPTTNNQTIKVVQVKAEETKQTKQTEESDTKHSPDTGIVIHKPSSLFADLLGMIGLGFLVGKRRKF